MKLAIGRYSSEFQQGDGAIPQILPGPLFTFRLQRATTCTAMFWSWMAAGWEGRARHQVSRCGAGVNIKSGSESRWDLVSLGEVMLRLDPGDGRIETTRTFQVWEGGGEYNVARGLRRCFGLNTAIVTAIADNPVGRLVQNFIFQGGVDQSHIKWVLYDGVGRSVRNGLNFTERGF